MADNVTLNPGSGGATFATDDIGGIHYQITKAAFGALDGVTLVSTSNGLPVDLRTNNAGNITVTIAASTATVAVDTELTTADLDTGAGTDTRAVVGLVRAESGGAVLVGSANPLPVTVSGTATVDTELPAAATLADNTANPTVPGVGAFLMGWDGAAWDRMPGTSANGLTVTLSSAAVTVTSGSITADTELPAAAALADAAGNPTTPLIGAALLGFNGTTWDRIRTTGTGQVQVAVQGTATVDTELTTADLDTGAGTDTRAVVGLVRAESGGAVLVGSANPLPVTVNGTATVDTELPAAATLADAAANPTTPLIGATLLGFNGTTWDRIRTTGTGQVQVAVQGTATVDTELTTADLDTGAGTDTRAVVGLVRAESGGAVLVGSANPLPVTVSGTATVDTELPAAATLADAAANPTTPLIGATLLGFNGTTWDRIRTTGTGQVQVAVQGTATVDTELPAAAAMADGAANPTTPPVAAYLVGFNGATWDRVRTSSTGQVQVSVQNASLAVTQTTASNLNAQIVGNVAHDAADTGNPIKAGGVARTTHPTAVASGNRADLYVDDLGRAVAYPIAPRDLIVTGPRISLTTTGETTLIAAAASTFHDLVHLIMSNESATEVRVDFRDTTAGTVQFSVDLFPDGGGAVVPFRIPWPQAAVNTNWTAQLSAAVSTVYISALAVKNN